MSSSSLSDLAKAGVCGVLAGAAATADAGLPLLVEGYGAAARFAGFAVEIGALAAAGFFLWRMAQSLRRAAAVCEAAAQGDLEARIFEIPQPGPVGQMQRGINNMLDIADAFVREARGSALQVSEGRYFRKVLWAA